jgi:hypothetical protein
VCPDFFADEYPGIAFDVEVNCKKDAGWPQGFAPDLTATAGETDCIDEDSDSAHPTVTPLPEVRVVIDEPIDDVCSDDQDGFTFTATVYNDNDSSDAKLTATAVWGVTGQPGTNCSVDPNADGEVCECRWVLWGFVGGAASAKSVLRCSMVQPTP